jgi:hypothetical protein
MRFIAIDDNFAPQEVQKNPSPDCIVPHVMQIMFVVMRLRSDMGEESAGGKLVSSGVIFSTSRLTGRRETALISSRSSDDLVSNNSGGLCCKAILAGSGRWRSGIGGEMTVAGGSTGVGNLIPHSWQKSQSGSFPTLQLGQITWPP